MTNILSNNAYKKLCSEINRTFVKAAGRGYWEACDLADLVNSGETTKERLWENLTESAIENGDWD